MTEEATLVKSFNYAVEVSQKLQETMKGCAGSVDYLCSQLRHAINLIESLSEQLDRVTRERDAAVRDFTEAMKDSESCIFCKHLNVIDDEGGCDMPKILPGESCWQWRGVEVEG